MIGYRCKDCVWFDKEHQSLSLVKLIPGKYDVGYCRKHFPGQIAAEGKYWGSWPLVDINDLCAEFRKQE